MGKVGKRRDRPRTERALILAVGHVLAKRGARGLTPLAVAQRAGVDRALIYRYFGDFDRLVAAYGKSELYWPSAQEIVPDKDALLRRPFPQRFGAVMRRYAAALRARPATVALLAAEMLDRAAPPAGLLERREAFGLELLALAHDAPRGFDVAALATVLTGSVHYLLVRARSVREFNGIRLGDDAGWKRIEDAIEVLARSAVSGPP